MNPHEIRSKIVWALEGTFGSPRKGVDMALRACVKTLVLFRHDHTHEDPGLYGKSLEARKYLELKGQVRACSLIMAYGGLGSAV